MPAPWPTIQLIARAFTAAALSRLRDDQRGEGVISTAIAAAQ